MVETITRTRAEGEILPPFYYGLAYKDYMRNVEIYTFMPFNWLVRFYRYLRNKWYVLQHSPSPYNDFIRAEAKRRTECYASSLEVVSRDVARYYNAYFECLGLISKHRESFTKEEIDFIHSL